MATPFPTQGQTPWGPQLKAYIDGRKTVVASRLTAVGHSYMHGSSTTDAGAVIGVSDMQTLIAAGVALPTRNLAVSGATLHDAASQGDWADFLQNEPRGTAFVPADGLYAFMYGLNDRANYQPMAPFRSALALVVARARCMAVFEEGDASVAFGGSGTWQQYTGVNKNSGSGCRFNNSNGATVTITPPAGFPGGTVVIGLPVWGDGSSCTWSTTVNGVAYSVDTSLVARDANHPTVAYLRIPGVRRNSGPITLTVSNVSGTGSAKAVFDWWGLEAPGESAPLIALIGQPKPLDYASQSGAPAGPVEDAGVDAINAAILSVVEEFDERVIFVDTSEIDKNPAFWQAGNVHPNRAGHERIALRTVQAFSKVAAISPAVAPASAGGVAGQPWASYTPVLDGTGVALGDGTVAGEYVVTNGVVHWAARVTLGATTTIGTGLRVSLPITERNGTIELGEIVAKVFRAGDGYYPLRAQMGTAAGKVQVRLDTLASGKMASPSPTTPLTWAAGDVLYLGGTYRAA